MSKINYNSFTFYVQPERIKIEFREVVKATLRKIEVSYSELEGAVELSHISATSNNHVMIKWDDDLYREMHEKAIDHYQDNRECNRSNVNRFVDFKVD